jgi:hypothetical protein
MANAMGREGIRAVFYRRNKLPLVSLATQIALPSKQTPIGLLFTG